MTRTACLNAIYDLAKQDDRVIFIGSDLAPNTMADFRRDFPDRWIMGGVQEQNLVGMASGLALEGYVPYFNTISTFLTRRAFEQILVGVCAHNLPVRLIGNGGGLVYTPLGLTHVAFDDIAIMRAIPNMQIICCSDNEEMKDFMPTTLTNLSPMYIRLGKDSDPAVNQFEPFNFGKPRTVFHADTHPSLLMLSTGIMTDKAKKTAFLFDDETKDAAELIHIHTIKPLDVEYIVKAAKNAAMIVTMEEGIRNGGLGSAVLEHLADNNIQVPVLRFGLPDAFPHHYGEQSDLLETYGLTPEKMAIRIKEFYDAL